LSSVYVSRPFIRPRGSQWLALCGNCTNYYCPSPSPRCSPCNAGFLPPAAQLPLLAPDGARESWTRERFGTPFLGRERSFLTPGRRPWAMTVRLTVGGFWEIVINLRFDGESGRSGHPIISHANARRDSPESVVSC